MNYFDNDNMIKSKVPVVDDGCDYTAVIVGRQNAAARARTGSAYFPVPKPVKVSEPAGSPVIDKLKNLNRFTYSFPVMVAVFSLKKLSCEPAEISSLINLPLKSVNSILKPNTYRKKQAKEFAKDASYSSKDEVLKVLREAI